MYFMSKLDKNGTPPKPIKCKICGYISKSEDTFNLHKGMHNKGNSGTQHDENLYKSGRYN